MFRIAWFALLMSLLVFPFAAMGGAPHEQGSASPAVATGAKPGEPPPASYSERAGLKNKLRVEQLLVKGRGTKGVEIEVHYRIVDVEEYAAHPKTTFVADETSHTLVPLRKLQKLFIPAPAEQAAAMPAATLTFWDKDGVIRPGQPVTVVVAGYGQQHIIPEAGPGYDPEAGVTKPAQAPNPLAAPDAVLKVYQAKVIGAGHLLDVRFSTHGIKALDSAPDQTYVENPQTGERHPVVRVPRLGALAPEHLDQLRSAFMIIDNAGHRIKEGQRVNVVVTGVRQDNILVTGE